MSATSSVTRVILWIVRLSGIAQLVVGVLLWTGRGGALLRPHMVNGFLIVALLWILAILALVAGARVGLVVFALAWGLLLPPLGMSHAAMLVGPSHWVIRVVHLVMGIGALGLADRLSKTMLTRTT